MKKKGIILSMAAGLFLLFLCVKLDDDGGKVSETENLAMETSVDSKPQKERMEEVETESKKAGEVQAEQESRVETAVPEMVRVKEPVVRWNGETGELRYDWNYNRIRVDADTLLLVSECYFPLEKLQQKIFFLVKAPDYVPQEVFRQSYESKDDPECLEARMRRPHLVDGGYIYEMEGVLYFLDKDFQEASPICDLHQLMGDLYSFSAGTFRTSDVTMDGARMLACTDEGLYEFDLEKGSRKLLEPACFAHHEIVLEEGDCACGALDFTFSGPVKAQYGPDGQSYAFLTGTEEAVWGDITGVVLRSGEGKTLYQKETGNMYDFKWAASEDAVYLAAFYTEDDGKKIMDRVNLSAGEVMAFEAPDEIYWGGYPCCVAGFLDEDSLFYVNYDKERGRSEDVFEVYHLSSGKRQDIEVEKEADWELIVLDIDGRDTYAVRYPK